MLKPSTQTRWRQRLFVVTALLLAPAYGHAFDALWNVGNGSWTVDGNWDTQAVPDEFFEDVAIITNGGVATLNTSAPDAAGLVLGQDAGESGTLIVQSGGSLNLVATNGAALDVPPIGVANIGLGGVGVLQVLGGGSFSTTSLDVNTGSTVEIGGGAGVASVASTDTMYLNGVTITHGPGHTFSADGDVNFEGNSQYIVDLQAGSHTTLSSVGAVNNVQGLLKIQTSGGYTPASGETWELLSGASISGPGFVIDSSLTTVADGLRYRTQVNNVPGGQVMELLYEAAATLRVNTDSGELTLLSESGETIDLVGYTIHSPSGSFTPANYNSLADQGATGWENAGATPTNLSELNPVSSLALNATAVSLGASVYTPPTRFGETPDVSFEYGVDGGASVLEGIVELTGSVAINNLLLTVDPTTGEAQLTNSSPFTIEIAAYTIQSESGSLDASSWTSLDSQSVAGWDAGLSASDEFALSEFVPEDPASTLAPGQTYSLGNIFQVGSEEDLTIDFALLAPGLSGDFNGDGQVDAADYTLWRDNLGNTDESAINNNGDGGGITASDYTIWASNYGKTGPVAGLIEARQGVVQYGAIVGAAGLASVPEPISALQALVCLAILTPARSRLTRRVIGR